MTMMFDGCTIIPQLSYQEECEHVELLVAKLIHIESARRRKAAEAMAIYIGEQRCLPPPEEMDAHPAEVLAEVIVEPLQEKGHCMSGVKALGIMGAHAGPYASKALAKMLQHSDMELRWETCRSIGNVGPGAAEACAETLGQVAIDDEFELVRRAACQALERLGSAAALDAAPYLAKALEDSDVDVQNAAVRALCKMGPKSAPAAAAAVVKAMKTGRYEMKRPAADALLNMGEGAAEEAAEALAQVLRPDGLPWSHGHAPPASDADLRQRAAETLGCMGPKAIAQQQVKMARALTDKDPMVRRAVDETLDIGGCRLARNGPMALFKVPRPDIIEVDSVEESALKGEVSRGKAVGLGTMKDAGFGAAKAKVKALQLTRERKMAAVERLLERFNASWLKKWMVDMGVYEVASMAEIGEHELIDMGLDEESAQHLLAAANVVEERKALKDLLTERRAEDLMPWMMDELGINSPGDLALLTEDVLVEEGFMSRHAAQFLLEAAHGLAEVRAADAADRRFEARRAREASMSREEVREEVLRESLAHEVKEGKLCWCGEDHFHQQSIIARQEEERMREETEQREAREREAQAVRDAAAKKLAEENAIRDVRQTERKEKIAKEKHDLAEIKTKIEAAAQKQLDNQEKIRKEGLRSRPAWGSKGKAYAKNQWDAIPLTLRLELAVKPAEGDYPDLSAHVMHVAAVQKKSAIDDTASDGSADDAFAQHEKRAKASAEAAAASG